MKSYCAIARMCTRKTQSRRRIGIPWYVGATSKIMLPVCYWVSATSSTFDLDHIPLERSRNVDNGTRRLPLLR